MEFIVEHRNGKKNHKEVEAIANGIYSEYSKYLESAIKDIKTVTCTFCHGVKDWSEKDFFINVLHDKKNKSHASDIKWSVFIGMVDRLLKENIDFLKEKKIYIRLEADAEKRQTLNGEKALNDESKNQVAEDKYILNVEPVSPRYSLSQLVLSKQTYNALNDVITLIKKKDLIYK